MMPEHRAGRSSSASGWCVEISTGADVDMSVGGVASEEVSPPPHFDVFVCLFFPCDKGAHTGMKKLLEDVSGLRH